MTSRTPNITVRRPLASDEREWLTLRKVSRDFLIPWEPNPPPGSSDENSFDLVLETGWTDTHRRFLILNAGGSIVGQCSLGQIIRGPLQQAFLGYWVGLPHVRKGYASAAIRQVLAYAFGTLLLNRIEANIQPHNAASIATVKAIGFRLEGFSPKYLEIQGTFADHQRWAILNEEFAATPRAARSA